MIFAARWQYALHQLQVGTSILLTAVDNLFHKHIHFADHREFWTYDTIHAYEDKYPLSVYNPLGFTINEGMNWLQATPKSISFVEKLAEQCGTMCDDQVVLNELIANNETSGGLGIEWEATKNDGRDGDDDVHRPARFGRSRVTGIPTESGIPIASFAEGKYTRTMTTSQRFMHTIVHLPTSIGYRCPLWTPIHSQKSN